ncbi:unnamed protein product [Ectocarpus fasciculatus]
MFRIFDPYALALSLLVGGVGFCTTFYFNTETSEWGKDEIAYPMMAMIYVYARNARFFESDEESSAKILEGHGSGAAGSTGKAGEGEDGKFPAPSAVGVPGLVTVKGPPLEAPKAGSLAVVFFFATWCDSCEQVLPAFLAVAARYSEEGITFAGVTQEGEEELRYFVETYQRSLRPVTLLADEQGVLTAGYQGEHHTKTIPHCYIVRGGSGGAGAGAGFGVVEWHGHPARLEAALSYIMDDDEAREDTVEGEGVRT